jgi:GntR family transcriptional regulator/MocR family aminotransferase
MSSTEPTRRRFASARQGEPAGLRYTAAVTLDEGARWLRVEPRPRETLGAALQRTLRDAITGGALRPGVRLPSSRALAAQLGVSRGLTSEAYGQLAEQGFLVLRTKAVPVVADVGSGTAAAVRPAPSAVVPLYDLTPTTPDVTLFPGRLWAATLVDVARRAPTDALDYGDPRGAIELRRALADHLGRTRGVVTSEECVVVVQGAAQGMDLLARVLAVAGRRRVVVEDPSLDTQPQRFRANGIEVAGWPVDAEGLVVEDFAADAVLVTPAHQFPTGAVLSGARRRALLAWARTRGALVIEDDYDAEFRYDREPVRALQGLDPDRVAYVGTASKALAPGLRLGWVVVPARLAEEATRVKHLLDVCSPSLDQLALSRLLDRGEWDRHVRHARATYRRRRDRLVAAIEKCLPWARAEGVAAGLHVLVRLPPGLDDALVAAHAERLGLRVTPLSRFAMHPAAPGLVIGYGRLPDGAVEGAVALLARTVDDLMPPQGTTAGSEQPGSAADGSAW